MSGLTSNTAPNLNRIRGTVHIYFRIMPWADREDIVQQSALIAIRKKLFDKPMTWFGVRRLTIDAYRELFPKRSSMFWVVDEEVELASPPNQWRDMEIRDKMLTPEEQAFQNQLEDEQGKGPNLARLAETRYLLGSSPLVPTDLWGLLPSGDGCSTRVDR